MKYLLAWILVLQASTSFVLSSDVLWNRDTRAATRHFRLLTETDTTYLPSDSYVSNALAAAKTLYPDNMIHMNDFPFTAHASLLEPGDKESEACKNVYVWFKRIVGFQDLEPGDNPVLARDILIVLNRDGNMVNHELHSYEAYVSWLVATDENSFLKLSKDSETPMPADAYVHIALDFAYCRYPDLMNHCDDGVLLVPPYAALRMSEKDDPNQAIHVFINRPDPYDVLVHTKHIHIVMDTLGRIRKHKLFPVLNIDDVDKWVYENDPSNKVPLNSPMNLNKKMPIGDTQPGLLDEGNP